MTAKKDEENFELMLQKSNDVDFLENAADEGSDLPYLILVQAMSELVEFGDAKPGQIANNATGETYGKAGEPINVIPLYFWKGQTLWPPREVGSNPVCRSLDGKIGVGLPGGNCLTCDQSQWGNENGKPTPPKCTSSLEFAFYIPDATPGNEIVTCRFSRTSYKSGRALLNRLKQMNSLPFGYVFRLSSRSEESAGNRYWVFDIVKHEDTNRLEKPLNLFSKDYEKIFATVKELAEKFRNDHRTAIEMIQSPGPGPSQTLENKSQDDEVPF